MRRIAVVVGSPSDLGQCLAGLLLLKEACERGEVELLCEKILTCSIHRATDTTLHQLQFYHGLPQPPDVIVAGAGWANHLTGMCDAYLRHRLRDTRIVVVGVAFEDPTNERHTMAAKLSVTEVPGTQVVFSDDGGEFIGPDGFRRACQFAISGRLPTITSPEPRPAGAFSLEEAVAIASASQSG